MLDPIDRIWSQHLDNIITNGRERSPRGLSTKTIFNAQLEFEARRSVILNKVRDLRYRFMMAEAYWILSGSNTVKDIVPWNPKISEFSDNGVDFFGAYGPKIVEQMNYIVNALTKDSYTRQAVINIWRESPPETKDVPCTVNMAFYRNMDELDMTVNMRSSDAWLGVPYDVFNFSMILIHIAGCLNMDPGRVVLNMVNAHLYTHNLVSAKEAIQWEIKDENESAIERAPRCAPRSGDLMELLAQCRDQKNRFDALTRWREQ